MGIFRSSRTRSHQHWNAQQSDCAHTRRQRLCQFCLDESGVALPVALAVIMVVSGLASVAARAAIVSNNQTDRDLQAKRATQAAYAGLQALRYQVNLLQPPSTHCVLKDASTGALSVAATQADGWCDPQTEDLGDGVTYTARISSGTNITVNAPVALHAPDRLGRLRKRGAAPRRPVGQCGHGRARVPTRVCDHEPELCRLRQQRQSRGRPRLERQRHVAEHRRDMRTGHPGSGQDTDAQQQRRRLRRLLDRRGAAGLPAPAGRPGGEHGDQ